MWIAKKQAVFAFGFLLYRTLYAGGMGKIVAIPDWAAPSLQGLAYWLGSQHSLGLAANISEGAIAWELMRQVFTHRITARHLEAEVFYRHIPEFRNAGVAQSSRERADLVISKVVRADRTNSYAIGNIEAVIEIKHSRSRKDLVWQDIDYLAERRAMNPSVRTFLIYASINERPHDFTNTDGSSITPRNRKTPNGSKYRVRRVCRATKIIPSKNKNATGHYAVLIEVAPPASDTANDT
ncbi:hypothetical protein GCN74_11090 [Janthinobacterium sp. FT14W]|uniref:hypothetical protein n=1 Tax=Janthinobacterium sp. FT14W TaxID=2654253 RepID=UPI0012653144|nr:hypothetical protein [Janthinobacterium sp. FT14W]KAB8059913.1 hypothetical protein GCN74_11090 [Janthinobacterium sp. FT14W]